MPSAQSGQALSGRVVELRLSQDGSFFVDGVPVKRSDMHFKLQELVREFKAKPGQFVLKAHPLAPCEALVFIVDEVRMQGGEKLLIATAQADGKEAGKDMPSFKPSPGSHDGGAGQ